MKQLILIGFVLVSAIEAQGQNFQTDRIQWNATGFTDLNHNTVVTAPCQFVTTGNQVDWVQGNGSYINSFSILGTSGAWPDLSKAGSLIISVKSDTLTGDITFLKDTNGVTIKLTLSGGTDPINLLYTISTIETL